MALGGCSLSTSTSRSIPSKANTPARAQMISTPTTGWRQEEPRPQTSRLPTSAPVQGQGGVSREKSQGPSPTPWELENLPLPGKAAQGLLHPSDSQYTEGRRGGPRPHFPVQGVSTRSQLDRGPQRNKPAPSAGARCCHSHAFPSFYRATVTPASPVLRAEASTGLQCPPLR